MPPAGRRSPGAWFKRAGRPMQLVAICLAAIFLTGLVLIADGLLMKADSRHGGARHVPTAVSDGGAQAPGGPILRR